MSQVEDENFSSFLVRRAVATQLSPTINPRNLFHVYAVIYQPRLFLLSAVYFRLEIYLHPTSRILPGLERNYVHAKIFFFKKDFPARIGSTMGENGKLMGNEIYRKAKVRWQNGSSHLSKNSCN